ncbi:hypothetical protein HNR73_006088 [Phytomonospora endophytica]|uniref:Uncharacterized protein n=1 Tax=Phytomonospora endophytica TaxID=714109 RepID=A0A841FWV0_9ACTN|nr:hypothetical protein [Phytomonospora endophytica]
MGYWRIPARIAMNTAFEPLAAPSTR